MTCQWPREKSVAATVVGAWWGMRSGVMMGLEGRCQCPQGPPRKGHLALGHLRLVPPGCKRGGRRRALAGWCGVRVRRALNLPVPQCPHLNVEITSAPRRPLLRGPRQMVSGDFRAWTRSKATWLLGWGPMGCEPGLDPGRGFGSMQARLASAPTSGLHRIGRSLRAALSPGLVAEPQARARAPVPLLPGVLQVRGFLPPEVSPMEPRENPRVREQSPGRSSEQLPERSENSPGELFLLLPWKCCHDEPG
jgi:hypothetical protein